MELLGYGLAVVAAAIVVGSILLWVAVRLVKAALRGAARKAIGRVTGIGGTLGSTTADSALRIGERELDRGVDALKRKIGHEMLVSNPKRMAAEVTKLARKHRGALGTANVMAELAVPEQAARQTLERLVAQRVCYRTEQTGHRHAVYVFPGFRPRREVKVCEFCGSTWEPDKARNRCQGCGAPLELATTATPVA